VALALLSALVAVTDGRQHSQRCRRRGRIVMKNPLTLAAVAEAVTGLALLIAPSLVVRVLLGEDVTGIAAVVARMTGIALIGLGLVCWPGPPRLGMLIYSAAAAAYLAYVGVVDGVAGALLWPAVVLHLVLTVLLGWTSRGFRLR
jgi:hypothetical protein